MEANNFFLTMKTKGLFPSEEIITELLAKTTLEFHNAQKQLLTKAKKKLDPVFVTLFYHAIETGVDLSQEMINYFVTTAIVS